jgi:hypothetical protein
MSRTRFWTILIGTDPTSFRAADREDLVPTLKQLQRRHPEAVLKWFDRDALFDSPEDAEAARERAAQESRSRDWRPGGEHRDPRARFKKTRDEKRRLFKRRQQRPWPDAGTGQTEKPGSDSKPGDRGRGDHGPSSESRPRRPGGGQGRPSRPETPGRPSPAPARPDWRDRPRDTRDRPGDPRGERRPPAAPRDRPGLPSSSRDRDNRWRPPRRHEPGGGGSAPPKGGRPDRRERGGAGSGSNQRRGPREGEVPRPGPGTRRPPAGRPDRPGKPKPPR